MSIKWQVMLSDFGRWKPIKTTAGSVLSLNWRGCAAAREAEEEIDRYVKTGMFISVTPGIQHTYWNWSLPFHWLIWSWLTAQPTNKHSLLAAEGVWSMIPNWEPIACHGWLADRWGGEEIKLICGVCPQWHTYRLWVCTTPCRSPASKPWFVEGRLRLILVESCREPWKNHRCPL